MTDNLADTIEILEMSAVAIDDVWAFFQCIPEGDRTFVKQPVTDRETVARWLSDAASYRFVARADNRIAGYLAVTPGVGWSRHVGDLRLVVDPEMRRRGIGLLLARHGVKTAVDHGLAKVVVEVVAEQDSTVGLFNRLGFRAEALLIDHVQSPAGNVSDLLILTLRPDDDWHLLSTVGLDHPLD